MEPLHRILKAAEEVSILTPFTGRSVRSIFKCSLYADDVALFVRPIKEELLSFQKILGFFAQVTGLQTNIQKTEVFPITCKGLDLICPPFLGSKELFPANT